MPIPCELSAEERRILGSRIFSAEAKTLVYYVAAGLTQFADQIPEAPRSLIQNLARFLLAQVTWGEPMYV